MSQMHGDGGEINTEARAWLLSRAEYNVMVTHTFRGDYGVSYEQAKRIFGLFVRRLRDELFGRRSRRRIPMAPVVEDYKEQLQQRGVEVGEREGTHIHCLMALPGPPADYKEVVRRLWEDSHESCGKPRVYCPGSDKWFLEISNAELRGVLMSYVLKRCEFDVDGLLVQYL
jgi:hypothetical protein